MDLRDGGADAGEKIHVWSESRKDWLLGEGGGIWCVLGLAEVKRCRKEWTS